MHIISILKHDIMITVFVFAVMLVVDETVLNCRAPFCGRVILDLIIWILFGI